MGDFKGVTFSAQNVTPKDDGALYNAHYGDGILDGCEMAISGDDLVIQPGHFIACGRVCHVDGATSVDLSGRQLQTGYIQVIMNYDLTQGEGQQWYTSLVESATTTFPALTKDDINTPTGELYQLQMAVVQVSGGNLTSIYTSMGASSVVSRTFRNYDGSGNVVGQLYIPDTGSVFLGANSNGGNIYLRPFGTGSSSNQMYINTDGQQIGGHPLETKQLNSASSISANTTKNLLSFTGLSTSGVYIVNGLFEFTPSANTSATMFISFSTNTTGLGVWRAMYPTSSTATKYVHLTSFYTSISQIHLNVQCSINGSAGTNTTFKIIRLA